MNESTFPDQIHLEKIRADLWCGREYGRAAVMVGAGFSRNAQRISQSIQPFPLLQGLASTMYEALYPTDSQGSRAAESMKMRLTSGSGVLRLGREYEAEFGRPALDELILKQLPDGNYLPGRLHRLLLTLPWADVFTTNYDTLVERARTLVHERKYDLVQTVHDIPGRMKPRIVKLHGSFPSQRPFIITEDDYRTYPAQFAPFVNMVQQCIMENSLCLIGFSGDDPNFLYWSGWVRDNLKEATPPIYLCGLLNLSPAARKVLQSRRVIPIDLSPLFPANIWPDPDLRHLKALEWLLLNLMHGATPELTHWPESCRIVFEDGSEGLPEIPPGPKPLSGNGPHFPNPQSFKIADFKHLREAWSLNRAEYPGWVVAPKKNRDSIWNFTENWIDVIFAKVGDVSFPENLFLLYELNWRLEVTLTPLFLQQVAKIDAVLNEINPFPHLVEIQSAKYRPDVKSGSELDWATISRCWVELAFALARDAREDLDQQRFRLWMDRLKAVTLHDSELKARWFHEEALYRLFRLDQKGLLEILEAWPSMPELPFWESKRAGLLAELGRVEEAERIAEAALSRIRSQLQPYRTDYLMLSQEGFVMFLLKAISTSIRFFHETGEKFRARWDRLESYGCSPWEEIERFSLALGAAPPKPTPPSETRLEFEPGRSITTQHIGHGVRMRDFMPAFGLLRYCELGGVPLQCGRVNVFGDECATAAKWVAPFAPLWSLSVLLRRGKDDFIREVFDRAALATITQQAANSIYDLCSEALSQSLGLISRGATSDDEQLAHRLVPTVSELLSRIALRVGDDQKANIFNLGIQLYTLGATRNDYTLIKHSPALIQRSAFSMSATEVLKRLPTLLSLPIAGEPGFEGGNLADMWPEPFTDSELCSRIHAEQPLGSDWLTQIERLLRLTAASHPLARRRASLRLAAADQLGALDQQKRAAFAAALWSQIDAKTKLPANTDFYNFAFLSLPEPSPGEVARLLRAYLLENEVPRMFSRTKLPNGKEQKTFTPGMRENRFMHELLGTTKPLFPSEPQGNSYMEWSPEEAGTLLTKVKKWWDAEKDCLGPAAALQAFDGPSQLRAHFESIVEVMAKVVLPKLDKNDLKSRDSANALLSEMKDLGFCVLKAVPMQLFVRDDFSAEAGSMIRGGLISNTEKDAKHAMAGLFLWLVHGSQGRIPPPPDDLLRTLVDKVKTRSQPALLNALGQMETVLAKLPNQVNEAKVADLAIGLDYLLTETELPEGISPADQDRVRVIPFREIPLYRQYASGLASSIYKWCQAGNKPVPSPVIKWKEAAEKDVLPEVRMEWEVVAGETHEH